MSAKARFLKKLQDQQSRPYENKSEADIAEFRQRMGQLQESIEDWLKGSGIQIESTSVSLLELLVDSRTFNVPGILLRYENRKVTFSPLYLYGQGVTGCVEVSLCVEGKVAPLYRLFMRSGENASWTWSPVALTIGRRGVFCEDAFFDMIVQLLP